MLIRLFTEEIFHGLTKLIHIVLRLPQFIQDWICMELLLSDTAPSLGHQDQFMAWNMIFLDGLGDDPFRISVGVDVCCIPLLCIRRGVNFECDGKQLTVFTPRS